MCLRRATLPRPKTACPGATPSRSLALRLLESVLSLLELRLHRTRPVNQTRGLVLQSKITLDMRRRPTAELAARACPAQRDDVRFGSFCPSPVFSTSTREQPEC